MPRLPEWYCRIRTNRLGKATLFVDDLQGWSVTSLRLRYWNLNIDFALTLNELLVVVLLVVGCGV